MSIVIQHGIDARDLAEAIYQTFAAGREVMAQEAIRIQTEREKLAPEEQGRLF